jgi:hypothetical protein
MIDYRKILRAYMAHIAHEEGITFVRSFLAMDETLTPDEAKALLAIHQEVRVIEAKSLL